MPIAPAACARPAFDAKEQIPRETSAIAPVSEFAGSGLSEPFGSAALPQRWRSTGWPFLPTIEPMSTSVWFALAQAGGVVPPVWIGTCSTSAPALLNAPSAGAKTCELETAATEIASGAVLGEPAVPKPKSSRSLPAAMTGTTPAAATLSTAATSTSFSGSACGPPPEKLMTSIPSLTACSNASAISGDSAM